MVAEKNLRKSIKFIYEVKTRINGYLEITEDLALRNCMCLEMWYASRAWIGIAIIISPK